MSAPAPGSQLPSRVTTPLLALITQQSLDEDYQHVAEQRRRGTGPVQSRSGRSIRILVALALFGALVAVAAVQTARNAHVTSAGREQLVSRIEERRTALAGIQDRTARLQADNAAAERRYDAAGRRLDTLSETRTAALATTGFGTVSGAGVRTVVGDAPGGGASAQVRDDDLALLLNGLWRAGATGIAVNGRRVTALSALRNSGQAIRINEVSLSPPYTVLAVGDTRTLQADFAESTSGVQFQTLVDQLGFRFTMENRDNIRLPQAPEGMMALQFARSGTSRDQKPPVNQEDPQ
jgi:uncharacterized protein YlxW (UPF0749 family)